MEYLCSSFSIDSIMNLKCLPTVEYVVPAPHTFSQRESSPEFWQVHCGPFAHKDTEKVKGLASIKFNGIVLDWDTWKLVKILGLIA